MNVPPGRPHITMHRDIRKGPPTEDRYETCTPGEPHYYMDEREVTKEEWEKAIAELQAIEVTTIADQAEGNRCYIPMKELKTTSPPSLTDYLTFANRQQPVSHWTEHHQRAVDELRAIIEYVAPKTVLDVGCGPAPSPTLSMLRDYGVIATGLDFENADINADMHSLPFPDNAFDLALSRHSLEHSLCPYVALFEMRRVAPYVLVVVPEYDDERWQSWEGHWSIFPRRVWETIFWRAGLEVVYFGTGDFSEIGLPVNHDMEWRWLLRRVQPLAGPFTDDGHYVGLPMKETRLGWQ